MDATIAAISTAMSASGIGIVRISGEMLGCDREDLSSKTKKRYSYSLTAIPFIIGFIYDGEEVVDEVLVMIMRGPHTYTGEDTVEIDCHGGVYAMKRVLETVLKKWCSDRRTGRVYKKTF